MKYTARGRGGRGRGRATSDRGRGTRRPVNVGSRRDTDTNAANDSTGVNLESENADDTTTNTAARNNDVSTDYPPAAPSTGLGHSAWSTIAAGGGEDNTEDLVSPSSFVADISLPHEKVSRGISKPNNKTAASGVVGRGRSPVREEPEEEQKEANDTPYHQTQQTNTPSTKVNATRGTWAQIVK